MAFLAWSADQHRIIWLAYAANAPGSVLDASNRQTILAHPGIASILSGYGSGMAMAYLLGPIKKIPKKLCSPLRPLDTWAHIFRPALASIACHNPERKEG